jgi:hypothetical protein
VTTIVKAGDAIVSLDTFHFAFFKDNEIIIHYPAYNFTITTDPSELKVGDDTSFPYHMHVSKEDFLKIKDSIETFVGS